MKKYYFRLNAWMLLVSMLFVASCSNDDNVTKPDNPNPQGGVTEFYNETVNKMIEENIALVRQNGYAELVIPASLYPKDMVKLPAADMETMDIVLKAGYTAFVFRLTVSRHTSKNRRTSRLV